MQLRLSNPALLYAMVWGTTYLLAKQRFLTFMVPVGSQSTFLVGASILLAIVITTPLVMLAQLPPETRFTCSDSMRARLLGFRRTLLAVAFAGFAVEAVEFGGLPILFPIVGNYTKSYADFGFPTVHGFLMALFFVGTLITALDTFSRPNWTRIAGLGLLLCWPVVLLNRGAMMWAILEISILLLLLRRFRVFPFVAVLAAAAGIVLLFGILGDLRLGENARFFEALISEGAPSWFREGPAGLVWFYAYLAGSLNNVNEALQSLTPSYQLYYSAVNLLPSVIRPVIFDDFAPRYALTLVTESFNTSTFFATYLADFGVAGALVAVGTLQLATAIAYIRGRAGAIPAMIAFAILGRALALTVFWDTATSLVTFFELCIVVWISSRLFESPEHRYGGSETPKEVLLDRQ